MSELVQTCFVPLAEGLEFRSHTDLAYRIDRSLELVPRDIDMVVGIPRSGMLPASQIGLALNLPVATLPEFVHGLMPMNGWTRKVRQPEKLRKILLVDDSTWTGRSLVEAKAVISQVSPSTAVVSLVVYGVRGLAPAADITLEDVLTPRIWQWNLFHHKMLAGAAFDLDGVMCPDPGYALSGDEAQLEYIPNAVPIYIPSVPINAIITARLEKWRGITEEWLRKHGVVYRHLRMIDLPDVATRRSQGAQCLINHKTSNMFSTGSTFMIESEKWQAQQISTAGRPVICTEDWKCYYKGGC